MSAPEANASQGLLSLSPEHRLVLAYAAVPHRADFTTLLQFDRALASATAAASEPMLGQIRLAWWRDLIEGEGASAISDPLAVSLRRLANNASLRPIMAQMVNGWERLLAPLPLPTEVLEAYASGRGRGLFGGAALVSGCDVESAGLAGEGWALADFAFHCSDRTTAELALSLARTRIDGIRLPRPLLPFTILHRFARRDMARGLDRGSAGGTPWRLYDAVTAGLRGI